MSLHTSLRTLARTYSRAEHLVSDAELLAQFAERRDDESFRGLVERHGPMVKAVCRRTSGDEHAAEDAFQAAFLTLARQAGRIRRPEALPGWLYKVAHSCGLKARRKSPTLPANERRDSSADPLDRISGRELLEIVDAELVRLPEAHRSALIVCTIEGLTVEEAAKRLKATTGAVRGWLERGREMLRKRLAARKIELSAVLVTLSAATSCRLTAGQIEAVISVLNRSVTLFPSVISTLVPSRMIAGLTTIAAMIVVGVIGGTISALPKAEYTEHPNTANAVLQVPTTKPDDGVILFTRAEKLYSIKPDGTNERPVKIPDLKVTQFAPSPDGRFIAFVEKNTIRVHDTHDPRNERTFKLQGKSIPLVPIWSPKGDELAVTVRTDEDTTRNDRYAHWLINLKTEKVSSLDLPTNHILNDWSMKNDSFLTTATQEKSKGSFAGSLHLWCRNGKVEKKITVKDDVEWLGRLSWDGTRVLFWNSGLFLQWYEINKPESVTKVILKTDSIAALKIIVPQNYCWSPDGKRIALIWKKRDPLDTERIEEALCIADPDGSNLMQIVTNETKGNGSLNGVYWVKSAK